MVVLWYSAPAILFFGAHALTTRERVSYGQENIPCNRRRLQYYRDIWLDAALVDISQLDQVTWLKCHITSLTLLLEQSSVSPWRKVHEFTTRIRLEVPGPCPLVKY